MNSIRIGKNIYIAPEELQAKHDHKSIEVWSLGLVLYELLTGK
jgi:serine/threonine protein kinase